MQETWFTAAEAIENGFADEIEEGKQIAASVSNGLLVMNGQGFDVGRYRHMPQMQTKLEEPGNGGESQPWRIYRY